MSSLIHRRRAVRLVLGLARRWRLALALTLAAASGLMVLGYMTIGYVIGRVETAERIRLYGKAVFDNGVDWIDRQLRGKAAVRAQAAAWAPFRSELHSLEINSIALKPRPTRAGAMTRLPDGDLLTTTAHGEFIVFNPATGDYAPAAIASPLNLADFRASPLWDTPGLDRQYFRINDILALPGDDGAVTLYATHYHFTPQCIEFWLSRATLTVDGATVRQDGQWTHMFTATPCFQVMREYSAFYLPFSGNLSGGRMLDFDAGRLLMTVGDQQVFEARGIDVAQDPASTMGKILLVDKKTGATQVFATGSRNAQGLFRDSRGRIWSTEHGPHGGDELNRLRVGANLGWPRVTYGVNYDQRPWPGATVEGRHDGYDKPTYVWLPSVGISNLTEASAAMFPNWAGDLLVGSLTGNTLFRIRLEGDHAVYAEPIRFGGRAIRDIETLPDGRVAILDNRMSILMIRNAAGPGGRLKYNEESSVTPRVAGLSGARATQAAAGAAVFGRRCAECHSLVGAAGAGPSLRAVAGRRKGGDPGFAYSAALANAQGSWSESALRDFILEPERYGETVAMPNPGLSRSDAANVAAYLTELGRRDRRR